MNEHSSFLFVISGPSAVGKSSVAEIILNSDKTIQKIITCTTRKRRANEVNGIDYHFMNVDNFIEHKNKNDFIEYSHVYNNYYGILKSAVIEKIKNRQDALLVVNWEGFAKIKTFLSKNVYGFFIAPPTITDLEKRIISRGMNSPEEILNRINSAKVDMLHANDFDFSFQNSNILETANNILQKINEIRQSQNMQKIY